MFLHRASLVVLLVFLAVIHQAFSASYVLDSSGGPGSQVLQWGDFAVFGPLFKPGRFSYDNIHVSATNGLWGAQQPRFDIYFMQSQQYTLYAQHISLNWDNIHQYTESNVPQSTKDKDDVILGGNADYYYMVIDNMDWTGAVPPGGASVTISWDNFEYVGGVPQLLASPCGHRTVRPLPFNYGYHNFGFLNVGTVIWFKWSADYMIGSNPKPRAMLFDENVYNAYSACYGACGWMYSEKDVSAADTVHTWSVDNAGRYYLVILAQGSGDIRFHYKIGQSAVLNGCPGEIPTSAPTNVPTKHPTGQPTAIPSGQPTYMPSVTPTFTPSAQPSTQPTNAPTTPNPTPPTNAPTKMPSKMPTKMPTTNPTGMPTKPPTEGPTKSPTSAPTPKLTAPPGAGTSFPLTGGPGSVLLNYGQWAFFGPMHVKGRFTFRDVQVVASSLWGGQTAQIDIYWMSHDDYTMYNAVSGLDFDSRFTEIGVQKSNLDVTDYVLDKGGPYYYVLDNRPDTHTSGPAGSSVTLHWDEVKFEPAADPHQVSLPCGRRMTYATRAQVASHYVGPVIAGSTLYANYSVISKVKPESVPAVYVMNEEDFDDMIAGSGYGWYQEITNTITSYVTVADNYYIVFLTRVTGGILFEYRIGLDAVLGDACLGYVPTMVPTTQPSQQPSNQPSQQPTTQPSAQPSAQPTAMPSTQPTKQPTNEPSAMPSGMPTQQPSVEPTTMPTMLPTAPPTPTPTPPPGAPTSTPTPPTPQPTTEAPTPQPTVTPSTQEQSTTTGPPTSTTSEDVTTTTSSSVDDTTSSTSSSEDTSTTSTPPSTSTTTTSTNGGNGETTTTTTSTSSEGSTFGQVDEPTGSSEGGLGSLGIAMLIIAVICVCSAVLLLLAFLYRQNKKKKQEEDVKVAMTSNFDEEKPADVPRTQSVPESRFGLEESTKKPKSPKPKKPKAKAVVDKAADESSSDGERTIVTKTVDDDVAAVVKKKPKKGGSRVAKKASVVDDLSAYSDIPPPKKRKTKTNVLNAMDVDDEEAARLARKAAKKAKKAAAARAAAEAAGVDPDTVVLGVKKVRSKRKKDRGDEVILADTIDDIADGDLAVPPPTAGSTKARRSKKRSEAALFDEEDGNKTIIHGAEVVKKVGSRVTREKREKKEKKKKSNKLLDLESDTKSSKVKAIEWLDDESIE